MSERLVNVSSVTALVVIAPPAAGAILLDRSKSMVAELVSATPGCFGSKAFTLIDPEVALPVKLKVLKAALTALGLPLICNTLAVVETTTLLLEPSAKVPLVGVKTTVTLLLSLSLTLIPLTNVAKPCVAVALLGATNTVGALAATADKVALGSIVNVSPSETPTFNATVLLPAVICKVFKALLIALACPLKVTVPSVPVSIFTPDTSANDSAAPVGAKVTVKSPPSASATL